MSTAVRRPVAVKSKAASGPQTVNKRYESRNMSIFVRCSSLTPKIYFCRLQTELMSLMVRYPFAHMCCVLINDFLICTNAQHEQKNPIDTISAFPDGDNLFNWVASIKGIEGTVWHILLPLRTTTKRTDTDKFALGLCWLRV